MKEDISERISSYWNAQICVDFRASIFSLFQIYSINFFVRRYIIQWNKNYNTSHFFVNEISVFQHKFHQQFFRQTSRRSRRHHELFVENKMLQKLHTYMHHNTPILIHFQQDWCFSIFKPNFFFKQESRKVQHRKEFLKNITRGEKKSSSSPLHDQTFNLTRNGQNSRYGFFEWVNENYTNIVGKFWNFMN